MPDKNKRIILKTLLLSLLLMGTLFASNAREEAELLGAENSFATAINKAKNEKKMLVMVIVKENCRWCDKLVKQTLSEAEVKEKLKNYVMLIVDRNDNFPNRFKEDIFPSIFYIDYSTQKTVYENVGFVGKKCFLNDLNHSLATRNEYYQPEEK